MPFIIFGVIASAIIGFVSNASPHNTLPQNTVSSTKIAKTVTPTHSPTPTVTLTPTPTITPTLTPKPVVHYVPPIKTQTIVTPTTISQPTQATTDTGLGNNNYYTNSAGNEVHSPAYSNNGSVPAGATAQCNDGTYSFSQSSRETCSHHGGVAQWL